MDSIRAAEHRREVALSNYQAATAELAWLHEGLRVLGMVSESDITRTSVTELFPPIEVFEPGTRPTLRQAIVLAMRYQSRTVWRVADLASTIVDAGWLDPEDAAKRVSDMAGVMVTDGQLVRPARGEYTLAPELSAEFELLDRMNPVPRAHYGLEGPEPADFIEATLRVLGSDPERHWLGDDIARTMIQRGWIGGAHDEYEQIEAALTELDSRRQIRRIGPSAYQLAPPTLPKGWR